MSFAALKKKTRNKFQKKQNPYPSTLKWSKKLFLVAQKASQQTGNCCFDSNSCTTSLYIFVMDFLNWAIRRRRLAVCRAPAPGTVSDPPRTYFAFCTLLSVLIICMHSCPQSERMYSAQHSAIICPRPCAPRLISVWAKFQSADVLNLLLPATIVLNAVVFFWAF